MVKEQDVIKIKTAIVLNGMLSDAQTLGNKNARITDRKIEFVNSFGKLSAETGITKGNLLSMFSGKTGTKINTLIPVLNAFGKTLTDFAKRFDKITDSDIQKFKERSNPKKSAGSKKTNSRTDKKS